MLLIWMLVEKGGGKRVRMKDMVPRMASVIPLFPQLPHDEWVWCKETGDPASDTKERIEGADRAEKEFERRYKLLFELLFRWSCWADRNKPGSHRLGPNREGETIADTDRNAVVVENEEGAMIEAARMTSCERTNADEATNADADTIERARSRPRPDTPRREEGEEE